MRLTKFSSEESVMGDDDTLVLTPEEKDNILSDMPEDEQQEDESEES